MAHLARFAFLLGILLAAPSADAKSDLAKAKVLFKQAEERYGAADYRAALELYEKAFAAHPLPGFHFNIAQCHRNLGEHDKAVEHFRLYLSSSKKAKHAGEARRLIQLSEAELAKQPTKPEPEPERPPPIVKRAVVPDPPPPPPRRRLRPPAFWTGVAVTAALLAAGTVTGALALRKSSRFKDPATPQADLTGLRDSGETLRKTSTVTFAVGAAAGVATGVLFFFTDFRPSAERSLSAAPIEGGAMVNLAGAF